jgi:hypothetical protein
VQLQHQAVHLQRQWGGPWSAPGRSIPAHKSNSLPVAHACNPSYLGGSEFEDSPGK